MLNDFVRGVHRGTEYGAHLGCIIKIKFVRLIFHLRNTSSKNERSVIIHHVVLNTTKGEFLAGCSYCSFPYNVS